MNRYFPWSDEDGYYVHCCWADGCFDLPFVTEEARDESLLVLREEEAVKS